MNQIVNSLRIELPYSALLYHTSSFNASKSSQRKQVIRDSTVYDIHSLESSKRKLIFAFGSSVTGALGIKCHSVPNEMSGVYHPVRVSVSHNLYPLSVACGYGFTTYLCKSTSFGHGVYGCGLNTDGQLGQQSPGIRSFISSGESVQLIPTPQPINLNLSKDESSHFRPTKLACGRAHTVISFSSSSKVADEQPFIVTFGNNAFGQCGREVITDENYSCDTAIVSRVSLPKEIKEIKHIVCGQDHTLLLSTDGKVYSCGMGSDGQLGLGNFDSVDRFTLVQGALSNHHVLLLASRGDTVLALTDENKLFAWGNNEYNQIWSQNADVQVPYPVELSLCHCIVPPESNLHPDDVRTGKIVSIACAGSMCAIVNEIGQVFVWGFGSIGLGPNVNFTPKPTLIPPGLFLPAATNSKSQITSITGGLHHFIAQNSDGLLWAWGAPRGGIYCLGLGNQCRKTEKQQSYPMPLLLPARAVDVACGVDHTIVLAKSFI